MSGQELADSFHQRVRRGNVVETKKTIKAIQADMAWDFRVSKDALEFGREEYLVMVHTIIKRLNAHLVAGKNQAAFGFDPDSQAKHSTKAGENIRFPLHKRVQRSLPCHNGFQRLRSQLPIPETQLMMVEYFAIECDGHVAIRADRRLVATCQVYNAQARCAERQSSV